MSTGLTDSCGVSIIALNKQSVCYIWVWCEHILLYENDWPSENYWN